MKNANEMKTELQKCIDIFDNLTKTERLIVMDNYNKNTGVKTNQTK